jgi:hypothetical protein
MKTTTKTYQNNVQVIEYLRSNFIFGKHLTYRDIETKFNNSASHKVCLHFLYKLDYLLKIRRGVYILSPKFEFSDTKDILASITVYISKDNKERSAKRIKLNAINNDTPFSTNKSGITNITDAIIIAELKRRGYKVMRPISQYEEV